MALRKVEQLVARHQLGHVGELVDREGAEAAEELDEQLGRVDLPREREELARAAEHLAAARVVGAQVAQQFHQHRVLGLEQSVDELVERAAVGERLGARLVAREVDRERGELGGELELCLLYTSPSPRD